MHKLMTVRELIDYIIAVAAELGTAEARVGVVMEERPDTPLLMILEVRPEVRLDIPFVVLVAQEVE